MDRDCPTRRPSKCPPDGRGRERQRGDGLSVPGVGDGQAGPDGQGGVALETPPTVEPGPVEGPGPGGAALTRMDAGGGFAMLRVLNRDARQRPGLARDPRWDRFVNGEPPATPAEPHPLEGSGFDWISAEDTSRLYGDFAGETNINGEDDDVVKYADGGGGRRWRVSTDTTQWRYASSSSARAIGGKPVLYAEPGVTPSVGIRMRNADDDGEEAANSYFSARLSAFVLVARRRTTGLGIIASADNNRPGRFGFPSSTLGQWQHFNSSGFQRPVNFDWGLEEAVVIARWNESTLKWEALFNGGDWIEAGNASDEWSLGTGPIYLSPLPGVIDQALFGVHDGDVSRADLEALAESLMSYYGIEAV